MIWKFLKQNVLFPKGLNWVQHWVSRIGLLLMYHEGPKWWGWLNGAKIKTPKKSLGLPTKPKTNTWTKNYGNPKESHAEFPSLKNFQKELNDITCKKNTLYCFEYLKKIPSLIKPDGTPPPPPKRYLQNFPTPDFPSPVLSTATPNKKADRDRSV